MQTKIVDIHPHIVSADHRAIPDYPLGRKAIGMVQKTIRDV